MQYVEHLGRCKMMPIKPAYLIKQDGVSETRKGPDVGVKIK
jgi:hypothetical protein